MEINRKGDLAEIMAVEWLWKEGYEVFRNVSCVGPIDLVVYMEGSVKLVDVKCVQLRPEGSGPSVSGSKYSFSYNSALSEKQKEMGVKPLWVNVDSGEVGWNQDYFSD